MTTYLKSDPLLKKFLNHPNILHNPSIAQMVENSLLYPPSNPETLRS